MPSFIDVYTRTRVTWNELKKNKYTKIPMQHAYNSNALVSAVATTATVEGENPYEEETEEKNQNRWCNRYIHRCNASDETQQHTTVRSFSTSVWWPNEMPPHNTQQQQHTQQHRSCCLWKRSMHRIAYMQCRILSHSLSLGRNKQTAQR